MIRKIIKIDREKCDGCGLCEKACHEGAIKIVNNKAVLIREDYCDGLGDCLPACPQNAISFEEREARAYKEKAKEKTELRQWPCQIKLVPANAPYFEDANLLIAADCSAYSYGNFHNDFMKNRITLIACPKLDNVDYSQKLCEIIKNNVKSIKIVKMEVNDSKSK